MIQYSLKCFIDLIIIALIAFPMILVFSVISLVILISSGSPIIFCQKRPGINGKPFILLKFRTMTKAEGLDGRLLSDKQRITKIGRYLRSISLDELPELINVLKGEMSLVGPRPLLMDYLNRYTPEQARRNEVKPGITGWAQVNGRNALSWEEKFRLDIWYIDNMSFWLDLKILGMTIVKIIKREGISQPGHVTMEEFKGSRSQFR